VIISGPGAEARPQKNLRCYAAINGRSSTAVPSVLSPISRKSGERWGPPINFKVRNRSSHAKAVGNGRVGDGCEECFLRKLHRSFRRLKPPQDDISLEGYAAINGRSSTASVRGFRPTSPKIGYSGFV